VDIYFYDWLYYGEYL